MPYRSPTTINATKGITEITSYVNEVSNNWFGNMLLISIWVLFFMGYLRSKGDDDLVGAFAVSSYVTFVMAVLLFSFGVVSGWAFGIVIGITMISSIVLWVERKN